MIYKKEDYNQEKNLVLSRISRTAVKRKYPSVYLEEITKKVEQFFALYDFIPNEDLLSHPEVIKAFDIAEKSHAGQLRKYTDEDYFVHLREVASFLSSLPNISHEEIIAGILHDLVEKTGHHLNFIKENFGLTVATHVDDLTDKATLDEGNRQQRIQKNWDKFSLSSEKSHNIKAIDILSNTRSIMLCDARYGETYLQPISELMNPYFQSCKKINPDLKNKFNEMTKLSEEIVKLQKKFGIHKIEKNYANQIKNEKKKQKLGL